MAEGCSLGLNGVRLQVLNPKPWNFGLRAELGFGALGAESSGFGALGLGIQGFGLRVLALLRCVGLRIT